MLYGLLASFGAGLISAVVFASATTGALLPRLFLFLITPLPLFLAGLPLGWRAAAISGVVGALVLSVIAGPYFGLVYWVTQAAPATLLCYLALLNRAATPLENEQPQIEWYPVGRIVMWTVAIATALAIAMLALVATDREALLSAFKTALGTMMQRQTESGQEALSEADLTRFAAMALAMLPAFSAMSWMISMLANLWLAGRVTLASGRLIRPWPDLASLELPRWAPLALLAAAAASFLPDFLGIAASAAAGALFLAYVLLGLAVAHYATRPFAWRPFALWALYAGMLIVPGAPVFVAILGLSESLKPLRSAPRPAPPPSPPPGG